MVMEEVVMVLEKAVMVMEEEAVMVMDEAVMEMEEKAAIKEVLMMIDHSLTYSTINNTSFTYVPWQHVDEGQLLKKH